MKPTLLSQRSGCRPIPKTSPSFLYLAATLATSKFNVAGRQRHFFAFSPNSTEPRVAAERPARRVARDVRRFADMPSAPTRSRRLGIDAGHSQHLLQSPVHLRLHSCVGGRGNHLPGFVQSHIGRAAVAPKKLFDGDDAHG
jgi:hypothetical protein